MDTFSLDTLDDSIELPRLNTDTVDKNQALSSFASKLNKNLENQKTKLRFSDDPIKDITNTSDILGDSQHKGLSELPDNPVNKLLRNSVSKSASQLKQLKAENQHLRKKLALKSRGSEQELYVVNDALIKKVQKYKGISESQKQYIEELEQELRQLRNSKEGAVSRKKVDVDDTEVLIGEKHNSKDLEVVDEKDVVYADDNYRKIKKEIEDFINELKLSREAQRTGRAPVEAAAAVNHENDQKNKNQDSISDLRSEIQTFMKDIVSLLKDKPAQVSYIESTHNTKNTPDTGINKNDSQEPFEILEVQKILEKYIKRKHLEKQLKSLENDEYLKYLDEITNSFNKVQPQLAKKVSKQNIREKLLFANSWNEEPTNMDDIAIDNVLDKLNQEYKTLLLQYDDLSSNLLKQDPAMNYKNGNKSMGQLNELLDKLNCKRQEIYAMSKMKQEDLTW